MKPEDITKTDWQILKEKYPQNMAKVLKKIKEHYPVQYLIGNVDFYDCEIKVNESVLIPRFETELFVDKLVQQITNLKKNHLNIIDLGTGSGCIAIALKKNLACKMTAIDISKSALGLAQENAQLNHTEITFLLTKIEDINLDGYDVIVSNPPYVSEEEMVGPETKYEPQNAIFASHEGLYFYQTILEKVSKLPQKPQLIAFEIGMNQASSIEKLKNTLLPEYHYTLEIDYQNRDRFIFLERL